MTTTYPTMWTKPSNGVDGYASDSSTEEEPQVRMRVGEMYQAQVPIWHENPKTKPSNSKEGMLIWSPNEEIPDEKLDTYCQIAKDKHSYNMEQALGILFWHKHDVKKSLGDMQNFTPMPDDWSMEDKVLFEQAYNFHGKNFRKIQQLIPDKEISQLVKHYYTWKKSRMKMSWMDRQATKRSHDSDDSQPEDDVITNMEEKYPPIKMQIVHEDAETKHKLPKGIQLNENDITVLSHHEKGVEGYLSSLDEKLANIKRQVQNEKQVSSQLAESLSSIEKPEDVELGLDEEWKDEEIALVIEGVRKYGENYEAIADILGTKSSENVNLLLGTRRSELNIDKILKEYEANSEHSPKHIEVIQGS
ncbi:unnamed protein product [Clavelina lepadiformis]|uniref:REST corepressor n=1 Tax=Clavelina lepadiformis TaxID=159417 RepID=A0ABP0GNG9_CLALP